MARLAGVSIATVSAVINGKNSVSSQMAGRVEDAMKALDYHPDHMARSLKTGRSQVVGMVIPDLSNPFFVELMCGVEETARNAGYSVIFSNSNEDPAQERANLAMLYSQRVGGVVLACSDGHAAYDRMTMRRFPIVFIDRLPVSGFSGRAVVVDNTGAACRATRHLIDLGHRDIAIIAPRTDLSNGVERIEGYRKAMQEADLPIRGEYFQQGDYSLESGLRCGLELLRMAQPPTAIFSCNNKMTLGLVQALSELEVPCPQFVSVVSFDDFPGPRISTRGSPRFRNRRTRWAGGRCKSCFPCWKPIPPGRNRLRKPLPCSMPNCASANPPHRPEQPSAPSPACPRRPCLCNNRFPHPRNILTPNGSRPWKP